MRVLRVSSWRAASAGTTVADINRKTILKSCEGFNDRRVVAGRGTGRG